MIYFPICIESYTTIERSLAVSFTSSFGRLGGIIAPYIILPIYLIDPYLPFLVYALCAILMYFSMVSYPIDNTG
jgi:hypothetical protein